MHITKMKAKVLLLVNLSLFIGVIYSADFQIKAKTDYFIPVDKTFREIYKNRIMYGGEISFGLSKTIQIWAGAMRYSSEGKLTVTKERTRITLIPLEAGLSVNIYEKQGKSNFYFGTGIRYYLYKEENPIVLIKDKSLGVTGRMGINIKIMQRFVIDIHVNYSHCEVKPIDIKENLGGFQAGVGLSFVF